LDVFYSYLAGAEHILKINDLTRCYLWKDQTEPTDQIPTYR
jgi:hypothetical protein